MLDDSESILPQAEGVLSWVVAYEPNGMPIWADSALPIESLEPLISLVSARLAAGGRMNPGHSRHLRERGKGPERIVVPRGIVPFVGLRSHTLERPDARRAIWKCLWTEREHPFIAPTIEAWIEQNSELVEQCRRGDHRDGRFIAAVLRGEIGYPETSVLMCALFAIGLMPEDRRLFQWIARATGYREEANELRSECAGFRAQLADAEKRVVQAMERADRARTEILGLKARPADAIGNAARQKKVEALDSTCLRLQEELVCERDARLKAENEFRSHDHALNEMQRLLDQARERADKRRIALERERAGQQGLQERSVTLERSLREARAELAHLRERSHEAADTPGRMLVLAADHISELDLRLDVEQGFARRKRIEDEREAMVAVRNLVRKKFAPESKRVAKEHVPRGSIRYTGFGGATEIGASAYLIEIAGKRVLVDCGVRVGQSEEYMRPNLTDLGRVDAVFLTHAHADHVGWLPGLVAEHGLDVPVYMTRETLGLLPVMLEDSLRHVITMHTERLLLSEYDRDDNGETIEPLYAKEDVARLLELATPMDWDGRCQLGSLSVRVLSAGHILGAASILLEGDGRRVLVSGDFSDFSQNTVGPSESWAELGEVDLLLLESTYGDSVHSHREREIEDLVRGVREVVESGGSVVIPCFALGRAQEVLSILGRAQLAGSFPNVPVWADGLITRVNQVYREFGAMRDLPPNFREIVNGDTERAAVIAALGSRPGVVVTTSGMMAGGPVVEYARRLLHDGRNRLFFTGYLDEESPGNRVMRLSDAGAARCITLADRNGRPVKVEVKRPAKKFCLSAHADRNALVARVEELRPHRVMLVHGTEAGRRALTAELTGRGFTCETGDQLEIAETL